MEAVKQGSAAVGLKSKTHALVCAVQRSSSALSSFQKKVFEIDSHMGIAIAGLTADARVLCKFMRNECMNYKFIYETSLPAQRLVTKIADKSQIATQRYGRRPYGVGLLVCSYDQTGAHLFETCPSGNLFDWKAQAIGNRAQSAKTYLEKNYKAFENSSRDELILHGPKALRDTLGTREEDDKSTEPTSLTGENTAIGVVGPDASGNVKFRVLSGEELQPFIDQIESGATGGAASGAASATSDKMDVE
jgi:20S proteasome subunit alpha 6